LLIVNILELGGIMGGRSGFKFWLSSIFLIFFSSTLVISAPVFAQAPDKSGEDEDTFTLEEIVVTGSRIARNNNESTSPIVTVDSKLFDQSATSALETQLNKLPQFTPTMDVPQVAGGDIQPTATNSPGEATVALRGIGANRTLVLINGRRGTPSNALGAIDINTIPTAAIQYVEAISGGASSTYGADAMAGVLNFIMKDRFEGFEVDITGSMTEQKDNEELTISTVIGTNFDDDKGNVMLAMAYNNRNAAMQRDRSWFRDNWRSPSIGGTMFFPPYSGINIGYGLTGVYGNLPDPDVMNSVMTGATFDTSLNAGGTAEARSGAVIMWDPVSSSVFSGFNEAAAPGIPAAEAAGLIDGYVTKMQNNGWLGMNNTNTYLIFPLERYNFYAQGKYEINENVGVFGQAYFSKTRADTVQEPGIIVSGWSVNVNPQIDRDVIPADLMTIIDSRPDPNADITLQALFPNNREGHSDTFTFNMTSGLEGTIPGIDWTWEAFVSYGEAENTSNMTGFYSLQRTRTVMQSPNFGQGGVWVANSGPPDYGFGGATATCTSGLNPFDWANVTQDCWDAIAAPVRTRQIMEQTIYEANTQGSIAELPTGDLRGALGISYRENKYEFLSDNINTQGRSFNDQVLGLYPSGESSGDITATEEYAELLIPIVKELPFAEAVEINLGGRRSDYNTTGVSYTYKAQMDWRTTNWLRFRGGYNRAERAPNIAELFLATTSSFGVMSYGDACSMRNGILNYSADPNVNSDNWYNAVALCGQLMEAGNPDSDADAEYYGQDWRDIYDYAAANGGASNVPQADIDTQPLGGFGFIWPVDKGNPDLSPEIADTWTAGFVLDSFVEDIPALMDWRISVDYYIIKIKDAIGLQTGDVVQQQCLSPTFNADYDWQNVFCDNVNRNPSSGALSTLERSYYNNGAFETSGIDFQINWGMEAGPGRVSVTSLVNYLLKMESTELAGVNPMIDYVGTYGPSGNGLNGNSFEWQALTTVTYSMASWDVSLRWQHLDSLHNITPTAASPLPSYDMFDLLGNYRLKDNISFRFGVENMFNIKPDLYGVNPTSPTGMYGGSFSTQLQDVNGRRFYVGTKIYF
jgi:iron complex outermembrane receptor protein